MKAWSVFLALSVTTLFGCSSSLEMSQTQPFQIAKSEYELPGAAFRLPSSSVLDTNAVYINEALVTLWPEGADHFRYQAIRFLSDGRACIDVKFDEPFTISEIDNLCTTGTFFAYTISAEAITIELYDWLLQQFIFQTGTVAETFIRLDRQKIRAPYGGRRKLDPSLYTYTKQAFAFSSIPSWPE